MGRNVRRLRREVVEIMSSGVWSTRASHVRRRSQRSKATAAIVRIAIHKLVPHPTACCPIAVCLMMSTCCLMKLCPTLKKHPSCSHSPVCLRCLKIYTFKQAERSAGGGVDGRIHDFCKTLV